MPNQRKRLKGFCFPRFATGIYRFAAAFGCLLEGEIRRQLSQNQTFSRYEIRDPNLLGLTIELKERQLRRDPCLNVRLAKGLYLVQHPQLKDPVRLRTV